MKTQNKNNTLLVKIKFNIITISEYQSNIIISNHNFYVSCFDSKSAAKQIKAGPS